MNCFLSAVWSHTDVQSSVTANWNEPLAATISQKSGPDTITLPEIVGGMRCQWMPLVSGRYLNMRINYSGGSMLGAAIETMDVDDLGFNEDRPIWPARYEMSREPCVLLRGQPTKAKQQRLRVHA